MATYKLGQKVKVFDVNGYGWDGEVTKIGRKYVTVTYAQSRKGAQFRIEDGRGAEANWGWQTHIMTLEAAAEARRLSEAIEALREKGLEIRRGASFTSAQLEMILWVLTDDDPAGCPAGHGEQCCRNHAACQEALKGEGRQ